MAATMTTTLNRGWLLKVVLFLVGFLVLGVWGFLDATVFYPKRGEVDASYRLYKYLDAAKYAGRLSQTKVTDAAGDYADLSRRADELGGQSTSLAKMEMAKYEWLHSLRKMWRLDSAPGRITEPDAQHKALTQQWTSATTPKPLDLLDLWFQWLFAAFGFVGAAWLAVVIVRARRTVFRWDDEAKRLTLPGGASFTPADVREFDKRKWHKFFVTISLKDGRALKLDLLRYVPLEEWVLEMERIAFPETAKADESQGGSDNGTSADALTPSSAEPSSPGA